MASDKSKTRDTNLSDARKLGLYPSVTNIIRILDKPQLNAWKEEQMVLAALTVPVIEGETPDDRARRVIRDAQEQVEDARKRGHLLHKATEEFLLFGKSEPHESVAHLFEPFPAWARENILEVEYSERVVIGNGYAGTLDLKADVRGHGWSLVDFKSRKPYQGKFRAYDEDGLQLAAYKMADANCCGRPVESLLSVFIPALEPGTPVISPWDAEDQAKYQEAFLHIFALWKLLKSYNPSK